ncbi:AfsR/SARP family transcriptional regulator [Labedaea rhizosphaerae]|uniref:DNA-binding SARP family transcriptional activator n=1 Tax=Labedaea rhizosphaerae TaxID=598644 RepID=A0A4R6SLY6_LABRH|nr:AfsR/SARP family transcriptional regulator [Labedaea rhizosphaerae]TDQ04904.1 DNA-binding SARP family transcriptional activator [Labedaea rhizosphaerae]
MFRVLGPLEVHSPGGDRVELGARKPTALLTTLLLQANAWVSAERLIAAIWPERDAPQSADRNLKTYVWRIRKVLPGRVESRHGAYRIVVAKGELDTDVFRDLVAQADREHGQSAVDIYTRALVLWRGTPFEEVTTDEAFAAASRLGELRRHAQESLARSLIASGRRAEAITLLRGLTADEPLRESTWASLVLALHADGRRAEALACYQQARTVLVDELGVEPGAELAAAQQQVLTGAPVLTAVNTLPRDLPDFVGRDRELPALLAACTDRRLVLVTGMAGVGKTALAVHVAHRLAESYPDGRLFVSLRDNGVPVGAAEALRRLLVSLGVAPRDVPDALADRVARWRAALSGRRVLVVLDDAEDESEVLPLLPGGEGCGVVVTGNVAIDGAAIVPLKLMPDRDATDLFTAIAGPRDPSAVLDVVHSCGNLPLAIRVAAARLIQRPLWTVSDLADRLRDPHGRDEELHRNGRSVRARFEPAYHRLPPAHRRLFDLLASAPERIDAPTAAALAHVRRPEAARMLDRLADEHLLTESAPGRFTMHPLVRDLARVTVSPEVVPLRGAS